MLKYRFVVHYQTPHLKQVSDFMRKFDLGDREYTLEEIIQFACHSEEKPVSYFKDLIAQAFASIDHILVHIEGGKIE